MSRSGCVLSSILLLLAGCAATPYQPANAGGYGYAEQKDADDAYTVMFVANTATSEQQAKDFALLRAAELGASLGFTYIKVVDSRSGVIMLKSRDGSSHLPATAPSGGGSYGMGGMGMGGGYGGGGYGGSGSYNFGSSSGGATPARAGVVRVRFLKQLADGDSAQPIQPLVARLRSAYALPSP